MKLIDNLPHQGNVLFLSNGCGGGHIQTVHSLEKSLATDRPKIKATTVDVYKNSFGNWIGQRVIDTWSRQQREGNVAALNRYLKYQWVEKYILSIITFFGFVHVLLKNDVDVVVNVQPFALGALLSAVRVVNCVRKIFGSKREPIRVELLLTELPNPATQNFFPNVRGVWASERPLFRLYTGSPLLEAGQKEADFWKTHCDLPMANVVYDELPLRQGFLDQKSRPRPDSLSIKVSSDETERQIIECSKASLYSQKKGELTLDLAAEDRLLSIHLGGQACVPAAKEYLLSRIQDQTPRVGKEYIFILCGENGSKQSLFAQVLDVVKSNTMPDGLHVVPLTLQTDREIAPLLARSDAAIIKSGGLTSMEVLTVSPDRIFIHSMCPKGTRDPNQMMQQGMPVWEAGNAEYLMAKKNAQVVTPETIGRKIYD